MRRALDSKDLFPRLFAAPYRFTLSLEEQVAAGADIPEVKWIQVAREGMYRGHWQGEFNLTRATFESFVKNLREHPQYRVGDVEVDGKVVKAGNNPTIPFDYEHASEMPATEGSIPQHGAAAPAWVYDVEVRDGAEGAELWALSWLGQRIRDQILRREYRQTSIAFDLDSKHFETGESTGPILTSIAFTNHPFLKHLESFAAANRGQAPRRVAQQPASEPAPTNSGSPTMKVEELQTQHEQFKVRLCSLLSIRKLADEDAIAGAAEDAVSKGGDLDSILGALGVSDTAKAMELIPQLKTALSRLQSAESELQEMLGAQSTIEEAAMSAEIGGALKSLKQENNDAMRKALTAFRTQCVTAAETEALEAHRKLTGDDNARLPVKKLLAARAEGAKAFRKEYGLRDDVDTSHLTRTFVASKDGQHRPPRLPIADRSDTDGGGNGQTGAGAEGETIDLSSSPGANPVDKTVRWLASKDPEFAKLPHVQRVRTAVGFMSKNTIVTERAS